MRTYNLDGDPIHPDWEHTMDGEYRPKGVTHTLDGDMVLNGQTVTQRQLDYVRDHSLSID
jgi:hypothetical protein